MKSTRLFFLTLFALVLAARLCHLDILWAEETLPLAAAAQMVRGKVLYRDVWFDKPPLLAAAYLACGARDGFPLRLAGALYVLLAFWSAPLAGIAFLVNSKGVFVLAACALWNLRALPLLLAGFAIPNALAAALLWQQGAL